MDPLLIAPAHKEDIRNNKDIFLNFLKSFFILYFMLYEYIKYNTENIHSPKPIWILQIMAKDKDKIYNKFIFSLVNILSIPNNTNGARYIESNQNILNEKFITYDDKA